MAKLTHSTLERLRTVALANDWQATIEAGIDGVSLFSASRGPVEVRASAADTDGRLILATCTAPQFGRAKTLRSWDAIKDELES